MNATRKGTPDFILIVLTLALVVFGLIMVFSASAPRATYSFDNPAYFSLKQLLWATIGLFLMMFFASMKYTQLQKGFKLYFVVTFFLLIVVLFTSPVNGSRSWLSVGGLGIQPSEFAKLATIIYLSSLISKKGETFRDLRKGFMPAAAIVGIISFLILLQPDLGSLMIFLVGTTAVIFAGGTRWKIIGTIAGSGFVLGLLVLLFKMIFSSGADRFGYLNSRFSMDPWADPLNTGYHLVNSLYALGHGGLTGTGLGNSIQKLLYLPEAHNDFIFPIIGEELGFIGVLIYFIVFGAFIFRGLTVSLRSNDTFGMLAGTGIVCMIAFQAFVNIGGVTNSIPLTGVTLPFISYGGSSMWVLLMSVGVLLNISRQSTK